MHPSCKIDDHKIPTDFLDFSHSPTTWINMHPSCQHQLTSLISPTPHIYGLTCIFHVKLVLIRYRPTFSILSTPLRQWFITCILHVDTNRLSRFHPHAYSYGLTCIFHVKLVSVGYQSYWKSELSLGIRTYKHLSFTKNSDNFNVLLNFSFYRA